MKVNKYQTNYSELYSHELYDDSRKTKAYKTLAVINDYFKGSLSSLNVLEIGCFSGEISLTIADNFEVYTAIDIDKNSINIANKKKICLNKNIHFAVMNAEHMSFGSNVFDLVICSHIYEHVPNPQRMMNEIYRVLKEGGICYFAAGNKFNIIEPHYRLPFLGIFPKQLAAIYLRLSGKGKYYYETHMNMFALRRLVSKFSIIDYTVKIIQNPKKFHASDLLQEASMKHKLAVFTARFFYWLVPTYVWVLKK
jgi:ubiquinone/menaquinone biosynthesis C-methylase UbiE